MNVPNPFDPYDCIVEDEPNSYTIELLTNMPQPNELVGFDTLGICPEPSYRGQTTILGIDDIGDYHIQGSTSSVVFDGMDFASDYEIVGACIVAHYDDGKALFCPPVPFQHPFLLGPSNQRQDVSLDYAVVLPPNPTGSNIV